MKTKMLVGFMALGITAAFAAKDTFKVNLVQDSIVDGKPVKAGQYKVALENGNAVMTHGKESIELPAHEVTTANKFESNELTYSNNINLEAIAVGGTHRKIVFGNAASTHTDE